MAVGLLLLPGCAGRPAEFPAAPDAGHIAVRPGRPGFVVAAPRGESDRDTDEIAGEIARRTGFGLVVATGRPAAEAAGQVRATYEKRVLEAAQGPLRFYAEILHGSDRQPCAGQIEIATVGIDREFALRLRTLAELIRDAHLRAAQEIQRLDVLVEPADGSASRASPIARAGFSRLPQRALQIALPRCARRDFRDAYAAVLADFLTQAATLPAGR